MLLRLFDNLGANTNGFHAESRRRVLAFLSALGVYRKLPTGWRAKTANWPMEGEYAVVAYALEHIEKTFRKTLLVASAFVLNHRPLRGEGLSTVC